MRSISLIKINKLREGHLSYSPWEDRGEFREMRELGRWDFGSADKMREGSPVHPLCPEWRECSVEAENVIVCHALDFPGSQKRDRPFSLPLAGAGTFVCCLGLCQDGFLTQTFLQVVCCSRRVCRHSEPLRGQEIVEQPAQKILPQGPAVERVAPQPLV